MGGKKKVRTLLWLVSFTISHSLLGHLIPKSVFFILKKLCGFGSSCLWHINLRGLFNAESILVEGE